MGVLPRLSNPDAQIEVGGLFLTKTQRSSVLLAMKDRKNAANPSFQTPVKEARWKQHLPSSQNRLTLATAQGVRSILHQI